MREEERKEQWERIESYKIAKRGEEIEEYHEGKDREREWIWFVYF